LTLLCAAAIFAVGVAWAFVARVTVYEVTDSARIESAPGAHSVQAQVAGRIVRTRLALGDELQVGDVLVELDAAREALELEEEQAKLAGLIDELAALGEERASTERSLAALRAELPLAVREAELDQRGLEASAELAEGEDARLALLARSGVSTERDAALARADARQRRAVADASQVGARKLEAQRDRLLGERLSEVAGLKRVATQLEREIATSRAHIHVLERIIRLRTIRASASGRLAHTYDVQVGTVLEEGSPVALIVPPGSLRVVASFPAATALGRLRPGQRAWLRLAGFPWTEYGKPQARVEQVGNESPDSKVRVELSLDSRPAHLSHGLPASVEVEVEQLTPAALLARVATRRLTGTVMPLAPANGSAPNP
jgi:membrane fusion protein (multidrug efflux system)